MLGFLAKLRSLCTPTQLIVDSFDETELREALTIDVRRWVRRDSTLPMDGDDWDTDLGFFTGPLVTVHRCMVDPTEPPRIEYQGGTHRLRFIEPIKNAYRTSSRGRIDKAHEFKVRFDPSGVLRARAPGRSASTESEDDES